jgi:HD-GYP domain-containing protein (c-di-GMP phosphodiesterase class II)
MRLAELLAALSHALDLSDGQPAGHCVRCCYIGINVGRELGLSDRQISDLYYTLLLKDLGCSSNAARLCSLYLTDDLALKRDVKTVDSDSIGEVLHFVLRHTGLNATLADRFRALVDVVHNGGKIMRDAIDTRCHRGADIARLMHFSEDVAAGIANLDEHWNGRGHPRGLRGDAIPVLSQIALMAQVADVFNTPRGRAAATCEIARRKGTWFGPQVVDAFLKAADRAGFWERLADSGLQDHLFTLEPAQEVRIADEDQLDAIAEGFAQVVDSKSPYTNGHSERVSVVADLIAQELGWSAERRRWLRRAALLHDVGKLGVSNTILDKPGKLDVAEWEAIKRHPAYTEMILSRIGAFADMAVIAGAHHERLDGKGYPKGLAADAIAIETRVLTVADVFDALTAARPYRAAMPVEKALAVMARGVGTQFDARCYEALVAVAGKTRLDAAA